MQKKVLYIYMVLSLVLGNVVFSGELSNFEIIGFNDSLTHIAFTEYGTNNDVQPYASISIVNLQRNSFVPNGVFTGVYPTSDSIDEDGKSAFYSEFLNASNMLKQYNINPTNTGNLIYILLDSEYVKESFNFTDYRTNYNYAVSLQQDIKGAGINAKGAFTIYLQVNKNGRSFSRTIGNQGYYREGVTLYKVRSIYSTSDNKSLVFVIETISYDSEGESNIHYMIETVSID